jgi:hypothetical protein
MENYSYKLKHPNWQKKRLLIFERDNFTCQNCQSTDKQLQVHHILYSKNPIETPDEYLITLCENCHTEITIQIEDVKTIFQILQKNKKFKEIQILTHLINDIMFHGVSSSLEKFVLLHDKLKV